MAFYINLSFAGNPHIGVHKHKEQLYVFSSKEAALKFASSSDDFIAEVVEKAKHSPELIHLLKLPASCFSPYSEVSTLFNIEFSQLTYKSTFFFYRIFVTSCRDLVDLRGVDVQEKDEHQTKVLPRL